MTEAQGSTLISTAQAIQQQNADIQARLGALGHIAGLLCWLVLACALFLAFRRVVQG